MTEITNGTIRVEQMLHGYSGGHRLLASSCPISKNGERHARMMSDLSGAAFKPGFDGYLTGYPLQDDNVFAIAKTWFAREQPRPGCVWTHTLLISFDDLGSFDSFPRLLTSFRQPSEGDFTLYGDTLLLPTLGDRLKPVEPVDYIESVIEAIYSCGDDIIALPAKSASEHESLLFAIWRQQWASLRSRFSFCTGALELRVGELQLDVQVIPAEKRQIEKASRIARIVDFDEATIRHSTQSWVATAARDLLSESEDSLKDFLRTNVDSGHRQRAHFPRYSSCFAEIRSSKTIRKVLASIAKLFPTESESKALKFSVAGPKDERVYFQSASEENILRSLLLDNVGAFDFQHLRVCERFGAFWKKDEKEAWQLLLEAKDANRLPIVDSLINVSAELVSDELLSKAASAQCELVTKMVARSRMLGRVQEVWKCRELKLGTLGGEFIDDVKQINEFALSVYSAWVMEDRYDCAVALAESIGPSIVPLVLSLEPKVLSQLDARGGEWHAVLRNERNRCLQWLKEQRKVTSEAACLALLGGEPSKIAADESLQYTWYEATSIRPQLTPQTVSNAYAKMLTVSFACPQRDVSEAVARVCFPVVYEALMHNTLSEESWNILHGKLPQGGLWWDRCKKLRMGLLEYCVKNKWSIETFIVCTASSKSFELVLESWGLDHKEKEFLSGAIEFVLSGVTAATTQQRKAAEKYSRWF